MKNAIKLYLIIAIIFLLITPSSIIANSKDIIPNRQDGRQISKLQWISLNGELPGTYQDYLSKHPIKPIIFFKSQDFNSNIISSSKSISLLVNQLLYLNIKSAINEYILDLQAEGYSVHLQTITDGNPEEIKQWIIERYKTGCEGFVFMGDITAAWAEVSGSVFPCDLFYMDLDGNWEDQDYDGDFEIHTEGNGDMGPEVFIGRIYAQSLNYEKEEIMVNNYLSKVHGYGRTDGSRLYWRTPNRRRKTA